MDKARGDYASVKREVAATDEPNYDGACFHAQQCVEKLMKAVLAYASVEYPKTHDLEKLARLMAGPYPLRTWDYHELGRLTKAAVDLRYPGNNATKEDAAWSAHVCGRLRHALLEMLEQPPPPAGTPPGGG